MSRKKTKSFKDKAKLNPVDFRSKKSFKRELLTVDFRKKKRKSLAETFLGKTPEFSQSRWGGQDEDHEKELTTRLKNHYHDHNEDHNIALRYYTKTSDDVHDIEPGRHEVPNDELNNYHSSEAVNDHLRHHKGNHFMYKPQIKHLDEVTSSHEAPESFHVYSGLHEPPEPGKTHHHHGYISSSTNPQVAFNYGRHEGKRHNVKNNHILKLRVDKGSKHGYFIGNRKHLSYYEKENEFLIGRNKKIHIHPDPEIRTKRERLGDEVHTLHTHIWHGKIVD